MYNWIVPTLRVPPQIDGITHGPDGNRITLSVHQDIKGIGLEVADTGPGIAAEDWEKVLSPFLRADTARSTEGNGLGLALVKSVADRHRAPLTMSGNQPGLRVSVLFPPDAAL